MHPSSRRTNPTGRTSLQHVVITTTVVAVVAGFAPKAWSATLGWQLDFNSGYQTIKPTESILTSEGGTRGIDRLDQTGTGGRKWSLADPAVGTNQALRIFQAGDGSCLTGAARKPKHRAMFHPTEDGANYPYEIDEHHWLGYKIWIPDNFPSKWLADGDRTVHHFGFQNEGNIWIGGDQAGPLYVVTRAYRSADTVKGMDDDFVAEEQAIQIPSGRWVGVVYHVLRKRDDHGLIEVWMDGVKKVTMRGRTASDPTAVGQSRDGRNTARWKIGLYWGPINRPVDFTIYLDDMRHARGADGYVLVDPSRGKPSAALLPKITPASPSANARLLYENTFEDGWNSPSPTVFKCVELQHEPGRYVRQTAVVRSGRYAANILNRGGDKVICTIDKNKHRAELATERVVNNKEGVEHWYGFSHYFPSNEGALPTPGRGHIIWQTKHGSRGPEFELQFRSDRTVTLGLQAGNPFTDYALFGKGGIPVKMDTWHDWVIRQKRSWSGRGILQIWHNGVEITNLPDTKGNTGRPSNRDHMEIHTGSDYGTATSEPDYVIYIDNFRYAAGAGGYSLVDPSREPVSGSAGGPDATCRTEATQ